MKKTVFMLLFLAGCVSVDEIRVCRDICGFKGVKSATWLSCQCHPEPAPCK